MGHELTNRNREVKLIGKKKKVRPGGSITTELKRGGSFISDTRTGLKQTTVISVCLTGWVFADWLKEYVTAWGSGVAYDSYHPRLAFSPRSRHHVVFLGLLVDRTSDGAAVFH